MRRRLSSAAFPLHRHSLPQLALDGVLVALAYELAYRLRFDSGIPHRYQLLLDRTIAWAVVASLVIFVLFRLYQQWFKSPGKKTFAIQNLDGQRAEISFELK